MTTLHILNPETLTGPARLLAPLKERSYELLQLQHGDCVLEVGCGAGADTLILAHWVGFGGEVCGVDADPARVAEAERHAAEAGVSAWTRYQVADPADLPLEAGYFDACRSERLLQHVPRPELALREMVRVTRPGGWVVAIEADYGTFSLDAPDLERERQLARFQAERLRLSGYAGRQLPRLFRRQGLADLHLEVFPLVIQDYAAACELAGLDRLEAHAAAEGLLSEAELRGWRAGLARAEADGEFFLSLNLVLIAGRIV